MNSAEAGYAWYLFRDGQQHGPITHEELHALVAQRRLRATDLLWRDGFTDWTEFAALAEFQPRRPPPPPVQRAMGPARGLQPDASHSSGGHPMGLAALGGEVVQHGLEGARARQGAHDPAGVARAMLRPAAGEAGIAGGGSNAPAAMQGAVGEVSTTLPLVAYILALVPIVPIPLIGLIIALVNTDAKPEWIATHYRWNWRTVVKSIPMSIVGALLVPVFGLGILVLLATFVWAVVRIVKGISALNRHEPVPNYRTWGWNITAAG